MSVEDSTHNGLRAAIRAIEQVVAPAVAQSGDELATEQVKLVRANLAFLLERVDRLGERARFELVHYHDLAAALVAVLDEHGRRGDGLSAGLDDAIAAAAVLRVDPDACADDVSDAVVGLRAVVSRLVRALHGEPGPMRDAVDTRVLTTAHRMIEFERAWFLPQGWEPEPEIVRALDDVLADARAHTPTS